MQMEFDADRQLIPSQYSDSLHTYALFSLKGYLGEYFVEICFTQD